jgi:hypothetical protein
MEEVCVGHDILVVRVRKPFFCRAGRAVRLIITRRPIKKLH